MKVVLKKCLLNGKKGKHTCTHVHTHTLTIATFKWNNSNGISTINRLVLFVTNEIVIQWSNDHLDYDDGAHHELLHFTSKDVK